jgi:hypothetical protein
VTRRDGAAIDLWAARDAVVLKALALGLTPRLPASPHCYHLSGRGGGKGAVRAVLEHLPAHTFVLKTDVQAYDASIGHLRLLNRLAARITDGRVLNLIGQYLRRCAEQGSLYWEWRTGIAFGCPLSPGLGAFFLYELDVALARRGFWFARYMDDLVVLPPSRWTLRRAVRLVNQVLAGLGLHKHPAKTCIGRISKGFGFLGYHFGPDGLSVACTTADRFAARVTRLYEQGADVVRIGACVRHWGRWVLAGIAGVGGGRDAGETRAGDHAMCNYFSL